MRKNINNPLPLMAWIRATINNATEKYEVSLYTLFGFSRSHFSSEGPITSNKELIQLKDELHEFFGTLDSMGVLRIIPIDRLLKTVEERFGLFGISYMERAIVVSSEEETVEDFSFPTWDEVMKRFGRNVEKVGRTTNIFKELRNYSLKRIYTKIRFTKSDDAITFDGTLLCSGESDELYFPMEDCLFIRENAWTEILKKYDHQDLKDYWY